MQKGTIEEVCLLSDIEDQHTGIHFCLESRMLQSAKL